MRLDENYCYIDCSVYFHVNLVKIGAVPLPIVIEFLSLANDMCGNRISVMFGFELELFYEVNSNAAAFAGIGSFRLFGEFYSLCISLKWKNEERRFFSSKSWILCHYNTSITRNLLGFLVLYFMRTR